jgi:hypothetical protein
VKGATKQDHVGTFWCVYPASAFGCKNSAPVGGITQYGRHVRASGLEQVARREDVRRSKAEDSRRTAQQLMRYRINSNATDVGGQRTTVPWGVGCAQI